MNETTWGAASGTATRRDSGPLTAERAVALVEQLAASLPASGPMTAGVAAGRAAYTAPEHLLGHPVGPAADVYAVACILFELLAGTPPFTGDGAAVVHGHLHSPVPPLRAYRGDLPAALDAVIAAGAAKNPRDRYPTAGALAAAARAAISAPGTTVPPPRTAPPTHAHPSPYPPDAPWGPPTSGPPTSGPLGPPRQRPARRPWAIGAAAAAVLLLAAAAGVALRPAAPVSDPLGISAPAATRAVAPAPASPGAGTAAPSAAPDAAPTAAGIWSGTYTCGQGETGLRLAVGGADPERLNAFFVFSAVPQNPDVPSGSFSMDGTRSGRDVTLRAVRWIKQPPGYGTVDLAGRLSADGTTFAGTVADDAARCTTFSLTREGDGGT